MAVNSRGRALPTARTATSPSGPTNDADRACPAVPEDGRRVRSAGLREEVAHETLRSCARRSARFCVSGNRSGSAARSSMPSQATGHSTPASKSHSTLASTLMSSRAAFTTRRRTSSRSLVVMSDFAEIVEDGEPVLLVGQPALREDVLDRRRQLGEIPVALDEIVRDAELERLDGRVLVALAGRPSRPGMRMPSAWSSLSTSIPERSGIRLSSSSTS